MKSAIAFACSLLVFAAACTLPGTNSRPPAQARKFTVNVTGSTADVTTLTAWSGDTITLVVSADKAEEIHLHGYDLHFEPAPGKPDTKTFTADKTGTFEYEIEATSQHLGNLIVNP